MYIVEENIPNFFSENNGKELYMISRCMVVGKKQGLTYGMVDMIKIKSK